MYKQASALFLTRRLPEALHTLEQIISRDHLTNENSDGEESNTTSPIASASKNTRVKVWNLYLALLNAIIELGPEDGKNLFGNQRWRSMVAKVRDGAVWDEVVHVGYWGIEGNVDADIVSNLYGCHCTSWNSLG